MKTRFCFLSRAQAIASSPGFSMMADAAVEETHDNAVSQVIDGKRIVNPPLNGRNAVQRAPLPGAVGDLKQQQEVFDPGDSHLDRGQRDRLRFALKYIS